MSSRFRGGVFRGEDEEGEELIFSSASCCSWTKPNLLQVRDIAGGRRGGVWAGRTTRFVFGEARAGDAAVERWIGLDNLVLQQVVNRGGRGHRRNVSNVRRRRLIDT